MPAYTNRKYFPVSMITVADVAAGAQDTMFLTVYIWKPLFSCLTIPHLPQHRHARGHVTLRYDYVQLQVS
eukprot:m.1198000 g.1198000  ORF g.1198000 m.1198000 type:complete len:70 (+) comp24569_c0_seq15:29-238(+)